MIDRRAPLWLWFALFTVSGFSGLIYESIWSHYLKLLLGHAAHAQTIVLAIFMGGMALGSALASRLTLRLPNLLRGYAAVEGLIGLAGLAFHPGFVGASGFLHGSILPALASPEAITAAKWGFAAAAILPQSCLLGMTFPLMTGGILRAFPAAPGRSLATLYFCNSLGAAIGVLASGFWLVAAVGLPGTVLTAGLVNVALAALVWLLASGHTGTGAAPAPTATDRGRDRLWLAMLAIAAGTGLASFIYEIAWLRMLSMVLGAATHSFELMLSAFILGLALGGLWVRNRIDAAADAPGFLGIVQIVMGVAALASAAIYGQAFEAMAWLLRGLARTDAGHSMFMLGSHALALMVMLPATFCAGMTLPLITHILLRAGRGERTIGAVYAANTVGAIAGVAFAVHVGMPHLGLRNTLAAGAALDLVLGVAILAGVRGRAPRRFALGTVTAIAALAATLVFVELDPWRMASGVYRYGRAELSRSNTMLFHRDGKTATINLIRTPEGKVSIMTNGKPDAAIAMAPGAEAAPDEPTMVLAAAVPLALRPQARSAANIGMGSGLTTSTLLASSRLTRVDTIEIEAAMVEGAQGFRPRVERAYTDPRGQIHIDDAKSFFAARGQRYDIIVSEPSNPWISGVANLFTDEFYGVVRRYLTADGVLVQWLQIYETDIRILASVVTALGRHFEHWVIYHTDNANILIVAANGSGVDDPVGVIFDDAALAAELERVGVRTLGDLRLQRLAGDRALAPLFASYGSPVNSDYFPYVDQHAARARFLGRDAMDLVLLADAPLPVLDMLEPTRGGPAAEPTPRRYNLQVAARERSRAALAVVLGEPAPAGTGLSESLAMEAALVAGGHCAGHGDTWLRAMFRLAAYVVPHLTGPELTRLFAHVHAGGCATLAGPEAADWLALFEAAGRRDAPALAHLATALLERGADRGDAERTGYLVAAAMLGRLAQGQPQAAVALWERHVPGWNPDTVNLPLRLLLAHARQGSVEREPR